MRQGGRAVLVLLSLGAIGFNPILVNAQEEERTSPYNTSSGLELSLSGVVIATSSLKPLFFVPNELESPACGECEIESINTLDRPVAGYYSKPARTISNITLSALVVSPFVFTALDTLVLDGGGLDAFAADSAVLTETFAAQLVLVQIVKYFVQRPRPFTYNPAAESGDKLKFDSTLSFFSGHSSTAFSMAVAYSITYQERHPTDPKRFLVWGSELSLAALTAVMRVSGGKHFWSDVITGSLVGVAFGVLIPTLHLKDKNQDSLPTAESKTMAPLMLMLSF